MTLDEFTGGRVKAFSACVDYGNILTVRYDLCLLLTGKS